MSSCQGGALRYEAFDQGSPAQICSTGSCDSWVCWATCRRIKPTVVFRLRGDVQKSTAPHSLAIHSSEANSRGANTCTRVAANSPRIRTIPCNISSAPASESVRQTKLPGAACSCSQHSVSERTSVKGSAAPPREPPAAGPAPNDPSVRKPPSVPSCLTFQRTSPTSLPPSAMVGVPAAIDNRAARRTNDSVRIRVPTLRENLTQNRPFLSRYLMHRLSYHRRGPSDSVNRGDDYSDISLRGSFCCTSGCSAWGQMRGAIRQPKYSKSPQTTQVPL